mmetsp:Transcript_29808/g.61107  ORF Transcript_29808/g.61107 Transcript_29808/m.61107 type:complete len:236 (+) Transcript_29808:709-1416(+)
MERCNGSNRTSGVGHAPRRSCWTGRIAPSSRRTIRTPTPNLCQTKGPRTALATREIHHKLQHLHLTSGNPSACSGRTPNPNNRLPLSPHPQELHLNIPSVAYILISAKLPQRLNDMLHHLLTHGHSRHGLVPILNGSRIDLRRRHRSRCSTVRRGRMKPFSQNPPCLPLPSAPWRCGRDRLIHFRQGNHPLDRSKPRLATRATILSLGPLINAIEAKFMSASADLGDLLAGSRTV